MARAAKPSPSPKPRRAKSINKVKPPGVVPKLKKDGTPYTPWADEVALRLKKKEERLAANGGQDDRTGKCKAMTTGTWGPKRPCDRWAIKGGDVCYMHGGGAKQTKEAAKKRLMSEVHPTIERLTQIRDQDTHFPAAVAAAKEILNRTLGKPEATQTKLGDGAPQINIGINLSGLPKTMVEAGVKRLEAPKPTERDEDDDTYEGEVVDDDDQETDDDEFDDPLDDE